MVILAIILLEHFRYQRITDCVLAGILCGIGLQIHMTMICIPVAFSANDIYLFRHRFARPPIQHDVEANLSNRVKLLGYALDKETVRPGESLALTLYWQANAPMETSYTVFAHIIDEGGAIKTQRDGLPAGGTHLTTHWRSGEIVVDPYEIIVGLEVPPGSYRIEVGMYQWESGQRLEVVGTNGQILDNRVILQEIQVRYGA